MSHMLTCSNESTLFEYFILFEALDKIIGMNPFYSHAGVLTAALVAASLQRALDLSDTK